MTGVKNIPNKLDSFTVVGNCILIIWTKLVKLLPYHLHSYEIKLIFKCSAEVSFHHKKMNNINLHNHNGY